MCRVEPKTRTYQILILDVRQKEIDNAKVQGTNALDAIENAIDARLIVIPPAFKGFAVAVRMDNICLKIDIGFIV